MYLGKGWESMQSRSSGRFGRRILDHYAVFGKNEWKIHPDFSAGRDALRVPIKGRARHGCCPFKRNWDQS